METRSKPSSQGVRKPKRHSDEYKCNVMKRAKVAGVEHTNYRSKAVAARKQVKTAGN